MTDRTDETERLAREAAAHRDRVQGTLDELEQRLSPGQLLDQALSHLNASNARSNMRGFGENLGRTARDNPMPVTLIGVGLAWLAMSSPADRDAAAARDVDGHTDGAITEERVAAADAAADAMERHAEETEAAFAHRRDRLRATILRLRDHAGESREALRERIDRTIADARGRAASLRSGTRAGVTRASGSLARTFEEQPLLVAAIGVGLGAAVAAALPPTRFEDEQVGPARDRMKQEASGHAARAARAADEHAAAAYRHARDEALRPGGAERATS